MENVNPPTGIDKREVKCLKCGDKFWLHIRHICNKKGQTMNDTPRTEAVEKECAHLNEGAQLHYIKKHARQLEHELNEAKAQAKTSDTERRAFIAELESVNQGLINELARENQDRDQWKAMAQELLNLVICTCSGQCEQTESGHYTSCHRYKALSRFNELNK